jgi:SAM-dependent methyltransferase
MKIDACRSCGSHQLVPVLSLGETPLANALLTREQLSQPEAFYPLEVVFCEDCTLVQITETVPPEILFRDYVYFSSVSSTVVENAREIVERVIAEHFLTTKSFVLEIASNDGYLLQFYQQAGIPVLGIEPARNIAFKAKEKGVPTIPEFFDLNLARSLAERGIFADVIHANNVLAHVANLNDLVAGVATVLKTNGVGIFEFPYLRDLIEKNEFDTIYHEHLCYYSLTSVKRLFNQHGLAVVDVERIPIHGGSLRLFVSPEKPSQIISDRVPALLTEEFQIGMTDVDYYLSFGARVKQLQSSLCNLLHELRKKGYCIAAYGASAKGATLLNTFNIGANELDFIVDLSPAKQNLFAPGTHLPIVAPNQLLAKKPDYVLLLTWNFTAEILAQQSEFRKQGGKFIIPIPAISIV